MSRRHVVPPLGWDPSAQPESSGPVRDPATTVELASARDDAIAWLVQQRLDERRAADGRCVGIQATLATGPDGENAIELYSILDGFLAEEQDATGDDGLDVWKDIAAVVREKLGFPLEPELFSNMLFCAYLGGVDHPELKRLTTALLRTFRNSEAGGLYHFFTSLRFACDIDCTAIAARARIVCGDLDLGKLAGIRDLRRMTHGILRSAAVCDVPAERNSTHGKDNGPLRKHVFKVYLDDHEVQGRATDRGLKNNPAVVANALYPLLYELRQGLRQPDEVIVLREFVEGSDVARVGEATVADLIATNVCYATGYLISGDWRDGCRYYPSPDAFLCFYSELVREFPELLRAFGARDLLREAVVERRASADGAYGPSRPLNAAFRAIAVENVGLDAQPELRRILAEQASDGGWHGFDCVYTLGTTSRALPVHFGSSVLTSALCTRALMRGTSDGRCIPRGRARWTDAIVDRVLRQGL